MHCPSRHSFIALSMICLLAPARLPAADATKPTAPADIPADLRDPGFERFVDLPALRQALRDADAALLADVALQLAEGERVLLRQHRAVRSEKLFRIALQAAAEQRDLITIDRLAKAVQARGDKDLADYLAVVRKTAQGSRRPTPAQLAAAESLSPEAQTVFRGLLEEVRLLKMIGDRDGLVQLAKTVPRLTELDTKRREVLTRAIREALAALPEEPDREARNLSKLAAAGKAGADKGGGKGDDGKQEGENTKDGGTKKDSGKKGDQ
jgi:hypothetical protein